MADPVALWEVFGVMLIASVLSFGGGSQVPFIQGQWVETGVLAPELFSFALGVTYLTPGPKAGFVAGIGYYLAGVPGAIVAAAGLVLPTCVGTAAASFATAKMRRLITLLRPSAAFIIGALIAAAAWGAAQPMDLGPAEMAASAGVAVLVGWRRVDPLWLVVGAVTLGAGWSLALALT